MNLKGLSDEELLSAFMPIKSAENLLCEYSSIYNIVLNTTQAELKTIEGMTQTRMQKILSIREIFERMQAYRQREIETVKSVEEAKEYFSFLQDKQVEEFWILVLDAKAHVVMSKCLSRGLVNATLISPREVFNAAIKNMATSIIIAHNHPSGVAEPSRQDLDMTNRIIQLGKILSIDCVDHIIVGKKGSISLHEAGFWKD